MRTRWGFHTAALALVAGIAASCGGVAGKNEQAFCDAVEAGDAATARTLLAAEGFNVFARNARGDCQPLKVVFDEAEPRKPEFTAMALELLEIPGVSDTTWLIPNSARARRANSSMPASTSGTGSPLMSAAANGHVALAKAIIAAGVDIRDTQGRAALTDAVLRGPSELVHDLIEAGADPNAMLGTAILTRKHDLIAYAESKGAREDRPTIRRSAARSGGRRGRSVSQGRDWADTCRGRGKAPGRCHAPVLQGLLPGEGGLPAVAALMTRGWPLLRSHDHWIGPAVAV